jgi:hypothetical protein
MSTCLVAICGIDRDVDLAPVLKDALLKAIDFAKQYLHTTILVVTRVSDVNTREFWSSTAKVVCVPHYEIKTRHSLPNIAKARQLCLDTAKISNVDCLWFLDSDVIPHQDTLLKLWQASKWSAVGAAYTTRWCGFPAVGIIHDSPQPALHTQGVHADEGTFIMNEEPSSIQIVNALELTDDESRDATTESRDATTVHILGFGCTLLRRSIFSILCVVASLNQGNKYFEGEDIGFFLEAHRQGVPVGVLVKYEVKHMFSRHE